MSAPHADLGLVFADVHAARGALAGLVDAAAALPRRLPRSRAALAGRLDEVDRLQAVRDELEAYSFLRLLVDPADSEALDLAAEIEVGLARFDDAVAALADGSRRLLRRVGRDGRLERWRGWFQELETAWSLRLDPGVEAGLAVRAPLAAAWVDLYYAHVGELQVADGERELSLGEALSAFEDDDAERRHRVLGALERSVRSRAAVFAACFDALVEDRLTLDHVRGIDDPLAVTALANRVPTEYLEALLAANLEARPLAQRLYAVKARFLGCELTSADAHLPWGTQPSRTWADALDLAVGSLERLSPRLATEARAILTGGRVETAPRGQGGSCNVALSARVPAYVAVGFDGSLESLLVLVHELGHALHATLAFERQPQLVARPIVLLGEVSALVSELLLLDALEEAAPPSERVALRGARLERLLSATVRQATLAEFERQAYAAKKRGERLGPERLTELWTEQLEQYYGPAVRPASPLPVGWCYTPHFYEDRFGTVAYPFASAVASAIDAQDDRGSAYEAFLAAGGSLDPVSALAALGVDREPWRNGLAELEREIAELEARVAR